MRKEDLSRAIDNVDSKIIENSLGYKPRATNNFKVRAVALVACLAIIVTAIPLSLILNREDEKEAPVVTTPSVTEIKTSATTGDKTPPQKDPEPYDIIYCGAETDEKTRESLKAAFEELSNTKVEVQEFSWYPFAPEKIISAASAARIRPVSLLKITIP